MTDKMDGQASLFDQDIWSGKMSQEPSAATKERTSKPSLKKSSKYQKTKSPICLCLTGGGQKLGVCTMKWANGPLLGEYTTHSFGESPREENASRLSQILQDSAPQKFYLSAKACAGILNRAEKRGKDLPEILRTALENQMNCQKELSECE